MRRPFLLRICPPRWRTSLYYRLYRKQRRAWNELYADAGLDFCPGFKMELLGTDEGHSVIAFTGFYEIDLSRRLYALAKQGGLLVDVGANYGYFSLLWVAQNSKNRCLAFEASPKNFPFLQRNIEKNGVAGQISSYPVALGKESGSLRFSLGPLEETGWGGFRISSANDEDVDVVVKTLDNVLPADVEVAVLKIDVEGAEAWVLYGANRLLKERRIKRIYFEQNRSRMKELGILENEAVEYLQNIGYEVVCLNPTEGLLEFEAWPKSDEKISSHPRAL